MRKKSAKLIGSLDFDGTNDSVSISDNDLFSINSANQLTVSTWVNVDALAARQNPVSKGAGSNYEWDFRIETDGFFMLGIPGETKEDAINTINFSKELGLDFAQFYITTPYPGTKLYEIAKNYGDISIKPNEWHKFNQYGDKNPVFIPKGWTGEELKKMQKKAWKSFYLRPNYLFSRIKKIDSFEEFKNHAQSRWAAGIVLLLFKIWDFGDHKLII